LYHILDEMDFLAKHCAVKTMHPEIPWRQMIDMRNKLVHHYFGVDWEIVDDALKNELPDIRLNILKIVL